MTLATLAGVLRPALAGGYAAPGLVCLGWEDMRAFALAAQAERAPVILQAGPSCRAHTPLTVLGAMMRALAADVDVPVVAHLDHGYTLDDCRAALDAGFTSLMFDGSRLPLAENIAQTAAVARLAHEGGASCEGEIGFVGNTHLQERHGAPLDEARIRAIEAVTTLPLVIHGGSGVPLAQRAALAAGSAVCKFNIGTELRMAFGAALRVAVNADAERFDRVAILKETHDSVFEAARAVIRGLGASGRV